MSFAEDASRPSPAAQGAPKLRLVTPQTEEASLWASFAGASDASEFCTAWLAIQCRTVPDAVSGLLLLQEGRARFTPAAIWPDRARDVTHLARTAQQALAEKRGIVAAGRDGASEVAYPLELDGQVHGAVVLELRATGAALQAALRQLHWGAGWLETLFRRRRAGEDAEQLRRTALALDVVAVAGEHPRLHAAAVAVATDLATRLECRRVCLGLAKRRGAKLVAISHAAWFEQKAQTVAAIESAMEEALDQDVPVLVPALPETSRRISLAAAELGRLSGANAVATVPLTSGSRTVGVLTFEREGAPFDASTLRLLEAVGHALGPIVAAKADSEKLVTGRIVTALGDGLRAVFGPRRPALKLAVAAAIGATAWLAVATGEFRVAARAAIEGSIQRAAVAPFEGFVATAPARAGDVVEEGQLLATLDDRELALEAARWRAERDQQQLRYQEALGRQDRAQARMLAAQVRQTEAQLALVEGKLERARIRAPFRGVVVSGDLSQQLGAPVETGRVLFEVAPLEGFRVVLRVDERDMRYVTEGQGGRLVLTGLSGQSFPVRVTKVTPVANTQDGRNVFRVEATVTDPDARLRPGMEGVAKLSVDDQPLAWIWTRSLVDWARMSLWTWLP
ncbi:HlyD family efflux transporter periplasmic adaptor subunit [Falsiroseomonas oryzae]|uniref:HlyD family efflux transporter periplasmic adaptor subunit n=1 Tax=Falsiroseomonas oryzae TaxID=2766473 RepID=UPI0022EA15A6|nr:HlyD family efflux transporter periplasmic adaptor subunit [Roseomonas sp. MO-31]